MPQTMVSGYPSNYMDNAKLTTPPCPRGYLPPPPFPVQVRPPDMGPALWKSDPVENHTQQETPLQKATRNNIRLTNDQIASKLRQQKGFTSLAVNTWEHVPSKEGYLPNSRTNMREVLVGSRSHPESHTIPLGMCANAFFLTPRN